MSVRVFVDTNVLLYALDTGDKRKHQIARKWRSLLWTMGLGRLSFQVLNEFYVNAIRLNASAEKARAEVRDLLTWHPVPVDAALLELGWQFQDRYRLGYWDSLIVAAAEVASCEFLLTEDLQSGQKFGSVEVLNPFEHDPATILQAP